MQVPAPYLGLTAQERAFVFDYAKFGNAENAKRVAEYQDTTSAQHLLRRPHVAAALRAEIMRLLATEGAQIGFASLKRIAQDTKMPAAAQVAAAKALLQGAGLLDAPDSPKDSKPLTEYSQDELRDYIDEKRADVDRMEAALAGRAPVVGSGSTLETVDPFD